VPSMRRPPLGSFLAVRMLPLSLFINCPRDSNLPTNELALPQMLAFARLRPRRRRPTGRRSCGIETRGVSNSREVIRADIFSNVTVYWPDLEYKGCLPGYRYCFSRLFCERSIPLYLHLVMQHERREKRVKAFWSLSYFDTFEISFRWVPASIRKS
jgi:hypothetical protein